MSTRNLIIGIGIVVFVAVAILVTASVLIDRNIAARQAETRAEVQAETERLRELRAREDAELMAKYPEAYKNLKSGAYTEPNSRKQLSLDTMSPEDRKKVEDVARKMIQADKARGYR